MRLSIAIFLPLTVIAICVALGLNAFPELLLSWPMRLPGALGLVNVDESFYHRWEEASALFALATESALVFAAVTLFARRNVA